MGVPRVGCGCGVGVVVALVLRLSPGGAAAETGEDGVVASFAAVLEISGGCNFGATSVRTVAAPSVADPHAMQRTAAMTFRKSHDGQTTPRLLVNNAGMSGP